VYGTKLLVTVGGENERSAGFAQAATSASARAKLVSELKAVVESNLLDGVDLCWQYPGFSFGYGTPTHYHPDAALVKREWDALGQLVEELREALGPAAFLAVSFFPDGTQEQGLVSRRVPHAADLLVAHTLDAQGAHHAPPALLEAALERRLLPNASLAVLLPFYGRHARTGEAMSYEDILLRHQPAPEATVAAGIAFDGPGAVAAKVRLALASGLGGVVVKESGQDCRAQAVTRHGVTHPRTCTGEGDGASLHAAISRTLRERRRRAATPEL